MSADVDSLDRGLVDVGLTAAEALARVEVVEARVTAIFAYMEEQNAAWEAWRQVTRPQPARPRRRPERPLKVVR